MLNTLAEIRRTCNKIEPIGAKFIKSTKMLLIQGMYVQLEEVQHPTPDFKIYSNGNYYLVIDKHVYTLYLSREIKKPVVETAG